MVYKNSKWEHKRKVILSRDNYSCRWCKRYGKNTEASHVHHIYPVEFYPEYSYCNWNLISLCQKCHNIMHDRDTHEITATGKILQRKVQNEKEKYDEHISPPPYGYKN